MIDLRAASSPCPPLLPFPPPPSLPPPSPPPLSPPRSFPPFPSFFSLPPFPPPSPHRRSPLSSSHTDNIRASPYYPPPPTAPPLLLSPASAHHLVALPPPSRRCPLPHSRVAHPSLLSPQSSPPFPLPPLILLPSPSRPLSTRLSIPLCHIISPFVPSSPPRRSPLSFSPAIAPACRCKQLPFPTALPTILPPNTTTDARLCGAVCADCRLP